MPNRPRSTNPVTLLKRGARYGIRQAAVIADRNLDPAAGITVLGYHQVDGPRPSSVNLPSAIFDEQLAWLADHAEVVSLDVAIDRLTGAQAEQGAAPSPAANADRPTVVITFDDGTLDFARNAVPLLVAHGLPATLYLATEFVEEERSFWDDGAVLRWDHLREAVATGLVDIGSHTHSHRLLDRIPADEIAAELDRSVELIADRLGVEARHFAYPKAVGDGADADAAVRARFRSAAVAGGGTNRYGATDPHQLARQPVLVQDGLDWFVRKARGGLRLEGALRERLDRRRYAGVTR